MILMRTLAVLLSLSAASEAAYAQHGGQPAPATPYAGLQERAVKALSDQQIGDLRAGRGMGLALSAELNGYPGPSHVMELADKLETTGEQRTRMQALIDAMRAETIPLGERVIAKEVELERLFAERRITPANLEAATNAVGAAQAALRAAHLRYHLSTLDILTRHQAHRYQQLRGYSAPEASGAGGRHRH